MSTQTQQVAEKPKSPLVAMITGNQFLEAIKKRFINAEDAVKFAKMFETAMYKTPKLLECTKESVMIGAYTLAELNLSPIATFGQAYLIPYKDNKNNRTDLQLQIGWRGLTTIAIRDGCCKAIHSGVVFKGERFIYELGFNPILSHVPSFDEDRTEANIVAFYATATLPSGEKVAEVIGRKEMDAFRQKYGQKNNSGKPTPWETAYAEMGRKTVVKRLCKYLPASSALDTAIAFDNESNIEKDITPPQEQVTADLKSRLKSKLDSDEELVNFNESTGEVMQPMPAYQQPQTPPPLQPIRPVQPAKSNYDSGDYQIDIIKAADDGINLGVINQDYINFILSDKKIESLTQLKKEEARIVIDTIEKMIKDSLT
jgi:phage RecT family recombinase